MKKISFKELAEIIGISAIVASLVFVGLEQRQANRFARLAALESMASEWISANLALAESEVLSDLLQPVNAGATSSDFTEIERERLNNILSGLDHHWEMRFKQLKLGVLERDDYSFPRLKNTLYDSTYHRELCHLIGTGTPMTLPNSGSNDITWRPSSDRSSTSASGCDFNR